MTQIEALWLQIVEEAGANSILEGEVRLLRIDPHHSFEFYAGVDGTGSVMLAIGVDNRPPVIETDIGALNYVRIRRAGGRWIMALRVASAGLEQVFGRLCQDLIDTAVHVATEAALVALFRERILLWKRLFVDGNSGLLQDFQIKGLVAELLALDTLIGSEIRDALAPVVAWIGPSCADQDFLFADRAIEVKAISPDADRVGISSAEQLDPRVPLELHVYVLRESAPTESMALTLPLLVTRIEQRLMSNMLAMNTFRGKLIEAGYVEHPHYQTAAFTVMNTKVYAVSGSFPRITRATLPNGIPTITYSISLPAIARYEIAEGTNAV